MADATKTPGQIAFEAWQAKYEETFDPQSGWDQDACWKAAASAVRKAVLEEAIEAVGQAAWKHEGDDAYSQGMDRGARHQVDACIKALTRLMGDE
jgi:hypothetical protein